MELTHGAKSEGEGTRAKVTSSAVAVASFTAVTENLPLIHDTTLSYFLRAIKIQSRHTIIKAVQREALRVSLSSG